MIKGISFITIEEMDMQDLKENHSEKTKNVSTNWTGLLSLFKCICHLIIQLIPSHKTKFIYQYGTKVYFNTNFRAFKTCFKAFIDSEYLKDSQILFHKNNLFTLRRPTYSAKF